PSFFPQCRCHWYLARSFGSQGNWCKASGLRRLVLCLRRKSRVTEEGRHAHSGDLTLRAHEVCGGGVLPAIYPTIRIGDRFPPIFQCVRATPGPVFAVLRCALTIHYGDVGRKTTRDLWRWRTKPGFYVCGERGSGKSVGLSRCWGSGQNVQSSLWTARKPEPRGGPAEPNPGNQVGTGL